ncbi:MAG: DinB family protein [bacterium]
MTRRPDFTEYVPYFADYVVKADDDAISQLTMQAADISVLSALDDDLASECPAPCEWSIKEILVHLCDFERMFNYRALRFSRGDTLPIEAFEQDFYVASSEANQRPLENIIGELLSLRAATILFFGSMSEAMLDRFGTAGGNPVSVRALLFIIAGHCEGHLADIRSGLPE